MADKGMELAADLVLTICKNSIKQLTAERDALKAQVEVMRDQKPVAWVCINEDGECEQIDFGTESPLPGDEGFVPLYLHPAPKQEPVAWVGRIEDGAMLLMDEPTDWPATPLYLHPAPLPEEQIAEIKRKERERCAAVCERLISGDGICATDEVWIHDCAEAIRSLED